jgi:hypothetical protein
MLRGLLPPFKVGERRAFFYKDNMGGASLLEYVGLVVIAINVGLIVYYGASLLSR